MAAAAPGPCRHGPLWRRCGDARAALVSLDGRRLDVLLDNPNRWYVRATIQQVKDGVAVGRARDCGKGTRRSSPKLRCRVRDGRNLVSLWVGKRSRHTKTGSVIIDRD